MSSNQVRGLAAETLDEEAVVHYLQHHADFFERHPQLLARLRLHHPRNGATVSLIERQVEVLREKFQTQEQKLTEFVRVARANNVLADKIHRFTRRLLRTTSRTQALTEIEASLREDFDAFHAVLVLPGSKQPELSGAPQRFVRQVADEDATFRSFDGLFAACKPRCGQVRDTQGQFLFGSEAQNIGSVALIPLGGQPPLGLLALGSVDHDRFHPGMSTEFLSRVGELITEVLARGMTPQAAAWLGHFEQHLASERRLSAHTVAAYRHDLRSLYQWCERARLTEWAQLDHQHVRSFAAHSHAQGLGGRSVQRRLAALRSFFGFLVREGVLTHNPGLDVRAPKARTPLPLTLDVDQMARLLSMQPRDALQVRDLALMELMYSSGLRLAEVVGLALHDLDLPDRQVRVLGKGSKQRIVPVGRMAVAALQAWLATRASLASAEQRALFVGRNGAPLGARAVQLRVAAHARAMGIPIHLHPHMFRHAFASHLLESSHDLRAVQELLGHASISTTQVYTHLDFQHLARTYDEAHPRAKRRS